jgi:hypothetical protein
MLNSTRLQAEQLHTWFDEILRLADESIFSIAPEGAHREAVLLDVLKMNARILSESTLDQDGKLYSRLCMFLAAAVRKLRIPLGRGHWQAALDNVVQLRRRVISASEESAILGVEIGGPALLFKQQFDQAVEQTGLGGRPSYLTKENRDIALALAVNWGIRLLLAYALEAVPAETRSNRKDLHWVATILRPLVNASSQSQ